MDMERYSRLSSGSSDYKLRKHCKAIRENQVSVAFMLLAVNGYKFEILEISDPNAAFARECLDELGYEGIDVWACSPTAGGIWTTPQRKMLKTGEVL